MVDASDMVDSWAWWIGGPGRLVDLVDSWNGGTRWNGGLGAKHSSYLVKIAIFDACHKCVFFMRKLSIF